MINKKHPISKILSYVFLIVLAYIMTYPLLWMIGAAFKSNDEIFSTLGLFPKNPVFGAFSEGWKGTGQYGFDRFLTNTFLMVLPTVVFTALSSTLVGYGFARFQFPFKKTLFLIMLSTMMLPATVIIIPRYIFFKKLGWLDSYLPFIIPALLGCFPFFNFMMVQFFRGLPLELDESAKLDGCNSFVILKDILLPLCKSAIFSVIVFQFVWTWNDFMNVLIYIS
ncbi:MAG: carbohydrate ABC transporter permease, partial [Sphaerochaeta sp.]